MGKRFWLLGYYLYNLLCIKLMSRFVFLRGARYTGEWLKLKEQYQSPDNILVVGNGPSLKVKDLELLSEIPSIASNKIYLLFDSTSWRPDLLTICDPLLAYKLRVADYCWAKRVLCADKIFYMLRGFGAKRLPWKNVPFVDAQKHYQDGHLRASNPWDGFFDGYTVTVQNIQMAIWLGAKNIYLIGVDHFYEEEKTEGGSAKLEHSGNNHFHKDYRLPGEVVNSAPVDLLDEGYRMVAKLAESHGVNVVNVSRRSALKAFPIARIEDACSTLIRTTE